MKEKHIGASIRGTTRIKSTAIIRTTVREAGASRHHVVQIESLMKTLERHANI